MTTVVEIMPQIMEWLAANNITPADVPVEAVPVIAGGRITCPVYLRNEDGNKYLDRETGQAARSSVTVPLLVDPPEALADWLAGKVRYR